MIYVHVMNSRHQNTHSLTNLQQVATSLMAVLVLLTFVGTNMQALLWQSSDWLVSTVLPAVVVDLTNGERASLAATPLIRNERLDQAARLKAEHMADNEYFAHFAPDGTTPWSFFRESGYTYAHAGENLAIHFTDSTEVVEAWMESPAHRKNIVDTKYTEIGVGTAKGTFDGYDTVYVVQLFGAPAAESLDVDPVVSSPGSVLSSTSSIDNNLQSPTTESITADVAALEAQIQTVSGAVTRLAEAPLSNEGMAGDTESVELAQNLPEDSTLLPSSTTQVVEQKSKESPHTVTMSDANTVMVSSELATSSGLAVATLIEPSQAHAGATVAAVATQPNVLLDIIYTGVVGVIIILLVISLLGEVRRLHVLQAAYSIGLLFAIGGLWYVHSLLTSGAVIV